MQEIKLRKKVWRFPEWLHVKKRGQYYHVSINARIKGHDAQIKDVCAILMGADSYFMYDRRRVQNFEEVVETSASRGGKRVKQLSRRLKKWDIPDKILLKTGVGGKDRATIDIYESVKLNCTDFRALAYVLSGEIPINRIFQLDDTTCGEKKWNALYGGRGYSDHRYPSQFDEESDQILELLESGHKPKQIYRLLDFESRGIPLNTFQQYLYRSGIRIRVSHSDLEQQLQPHIDKIRELIDNGCTVAALRNYLREEHGIDLKYITVYQWLQRNKLLPIKDNPSVIAHNKEWIEKLHHRGLSPSEITHILEGHGAPASLTEIEEYLKELKKNPA